MVRQASGDFWLFIEDDGADPVALAEHCFGAAAHRALVSHPGPRYLPPPRGGHVGVVLRVPPMANVTRRRILFDVMRSRPKSLVWWTGSAFERAAGIEASSRLLVAFAQECSRAARRWTEARAFVASGRLALGGRGRLGRRRSRERPRIHCVIPFLEVGGAQRQVALLVNGLIARGYDAWLVCRAGQESAPLSHLVAADRVLMPFESGDPIVPGRVMQERFAYARRYTPDVVISFLTGEYCLSAPAYALAGVPVIINSERWMSARHDPLGAIPWWRVANRTACLIADATVVNSAAGMGDLAQYTGLDRSRFTVISNGFDPKGVPRIDASARDKTRLELAIRNDQIAVGTACRFAPEKDVATFLRALRRLLEADSRIVGVIVGYGPQQKELESLADSLGIAPRIRWVPKTATPWPFYASFDVFVLASLLEGQPNVLLEFLELGIPCVATDAGGSREVLDDGRCGRIVAVRDDAAIASAVLDIVAHPDAAAQAVQRGRERVRSAFSTDRMVTDYQRLIESLLEG